MSQETVSSNEPMTEDLAGWGNFPVVPGVRRSFNGQASLDRAMGEGGHYIPRGLGRSYGDAALGDQVLDTTRFNRLLDFDETTGVLFCEAGVSFDDIIKVFLPRGWFLPVTPGTRFVTVGGAIAADVHGKNHHVAGSFGRHVTAMDILTPMGETVTCSRDQSANLFLATLGGMGLTGLILRARFQLQRVETAYIRQELARFNCLEAIMDAFADSAETTYSVAWIDGLARGRKLGRSVLFKGEHARLDELPRKWRKAPLVPGSKMRLGIPFPLPSLTLNPLTVKAFNIAYYNKAPRRWSNKIIDYDTFFYPLDNILHWNRLYGRSGFTQYQFVLPLESSREGLSLILDRIARSGEGSFLSVLKLFGNQDCESGGGLMSFPMKGYTLALDFPIRKNTLALLDELDAIVLDHAGRLYLAKDARMAPDTLRRSYETFKEWQGVKQRLDPHQRLCSTQSQRLEVSP